MNGKERTDFGNRVLQALAAAELTQVRAAKLLSQKLNREIKPQTIQYMASSADESALTADLAALCGVRYEWLARGTGPMREIDELGIEGVSSEAFVEIPAMVLKAAAGKGYLPDYVEIKGGRAYTKEFFRQERVDPRNCFRIKVDGHSMEPTLWDGDWVLVNGADKELRNNKVYAFQVHDEIRVKRFFLQTDGSLLIHSDNKAFPEERLFDSSSVSVLGRVIDKSGKGGL